MIHDLSPETEAQCSGAVQRRESAQRPFLTIQPARLPPQPALVKNKTKHCFYLPTKNPPWVPTACQSRAHLLLAGQSRPAVSAPLCHGCIPVYPRLRSPSGPALSFFLCAYVVLPGLEDLASTPLSPLVSGSVLDCLRPSRFRPPSDSVLYTIWHTPSSRSHCFGCEFTLWTGSEVKPSPLWNNARSG